MATESATPPGPRVLVLGALGFIGRHLLKALVADGAAASVRIVDKKVPPMAYLSDEHKALIRLPNVEYVQADLAEDSHVTAAFDPAKGAFDAVVCLAAETSCAADAERQAKTVDVAAKCGAAAVATGVGKFVYVSTAAVYKPAKTPNTEASTTAPWTTPATRQFEAEQALRKIAGLPLVILRPAIVYGPDAVSGIMPRVVCAAAYTKLKEKMKFLWDSSMRLSTVHVQDVVKGIVHAAKSLPAGAVFNLADKNGTDQGKINTVLGDLFGIETGFMGKIISNVARMALGTAVDTANDKHLAPWVELLREHGIEHTPLTPFLHLEELRSNQFSVDGSAIEATGFTYDVPVLTRERMAEIVQHAIRRHHFPPVAAGLPGGGAGGGGGAAAATAATAAAGAGGASA